jgi:ABC-2 type transport system permease protein
VTESTGTESTATEPATGRKSPSPATRRAFRPERTLPLRVELERQLRRRRTQVVFGLVVLLPVLLWLAFELAPDAPPTGSLTLVDLATSSGLNFTVFAMFASSSFLLVVVVALFFGDTVAAEASWSSLRYLLAAPVPRARLLRQKAVVAAALSLAALLLLPVVSLVVGTLAYGAGDMMSPTGVTLDYGPGTVRVLSGAV